MTWIVPWRAEHNCNIHGHRFQARYDEKPRPGDLEGRMSAEEARELLVTRIYVHDICIRCGMIVKRTGE